MGAADAMSTCITTPEQPYVPGIPSRAVVTPVYGWDAGANSLQQYPGDARIRFTMEPAIGVVLGFVGVLVAFRPGAMGFGLGHFAAAGSALIFAVTLVMIRIAPPRESDLALVICPMVILALGSGIVTLLTTGFPVPSAGEIALVLLAGFCLFVGNLLIVRAYRVGAASFVAPFQYCLIFWGALNGWLVFGASVELFTWIGAAIIIAAGLMVLRADRANA